MIKRDLNYLEMVHRTIELINEYNEHWQNNTAMCTILNKVNSLKTKIEEYEEIQQRKTTGYANQKRKQRQTVVDLTDIIASSLQSYALATVNEVLFGKVQYSHWVIGRLRDQDLQFLVNNIIEIATPIIPVLPEYGITQEFIETYLAEAKKFKEMVSLPAQAIKYRKTVTKGIKSKMRELRTLMSVRLDSFMKQYKVSNPDFYSLYKISREIKDTPTHSLSLKGEVTDINTKEPLYQTIVTIPELKQETKTTEKGNYQFKSIKSGTYKLIFQRVGYKPKTITTEILGNITTMLDVNLERISDVMIC